MRDGQSQSEIAQDTQVQGSIGQPADGQIVNYGQSALEAAQTALRIARDDIERLKAELTARRHEFETIQSTLWQREEEIAQTRASLDQERQNAAQAGIVQADNDNRLEAMEKKLKEANDWVFRLAGERKSAEDRAAKAESRLTAAEKASNFLSTRLSEIKNDQDKKSKEQASLRREKEQLLQIIESLRLDGEEAAQRLAHSQSEIVALSKILQQRENELAVAAQSGGQIQANPAETRMLSTMLQNSQAEADRSARQSEWLQKVNGVVTGYPRWWALMPKQWRLRRENRRLLRKGLFDAEAYLARYPDVSASGMNPLRHYIVHGINENRSF